MVTGIEIEVTGITELKDHTGKMIGSLDEMNDKECKVLAQWFESRIKRNALIMVPHRYRRSGQLENSIIQRKIGDKNYVVEMADYGIYLNKGSKPHIMRRHDGKNFVWKHDGDWEWHYARDNIVHHPGHIPYLFLTSALLETNAQTKQYGYNIKRRIKSFYK